MGPSELEELLYEGRSYPVRLTLSSGDQDVVQPDQVVLFHSLTLVLPAKPRNGRVTGEPRFISVPNVAMARPLSGGRGRGGDADDEGWTMNAREVEELVSERPFRPFRLVLDTGERVTVRKPRKALLSGQTVAVVGVSQRDERAAGVEKLRLVRVDRIVSAEHVAADETRA